MVSTGEYTEAYRVEEVVKDNEFDLLLEDSINKDVGEDIGATLKERNIVAMKGTGVVTETKITLPPSQAPIEQAAFLGARRGVLVMAARSTPTVHARCNQSTRRSKTVN